MECPKCNAELNRSAQFCWKCGAPTGAAAPAGSAIATQRAVPWTAITAGALVVLGVAAVLVVRLGLLGGSAVNTEAGGGQGAGHVGATAPGSLAPGAPVTGAPAGTPGGRVTATAPGGLGAGQPVTGAGPGSFPTAPGLPQTSPPSQGAGAEDIAAYLRKLEAIQRRDAENPMAQLFAMMSLGLSGLGQIGRELGGDESVQPKEPTDYLRTFDDLLRQKQGLVTSFQAISPVPQACQHLHALYGRYLQTQAQAILDLRSAVAQADNAAAPLAALPAGRSAESAQAAARIEEDGIRQRYGIARTMAPLVP